MHLSSRDACRRNRPAADGGDGMIGRELNGAWRRVSVGAEGYSCSLNDAFVVLAATVRRTVELALVACDDARVRPGIIRAAGVGNRFGAIRSKFENGTKAFCRHSLLPGPENVMP